MIAGTLEIRLFAELARLQRDMSEAKRTVGDSMKSIENAVRQAKTVLASLGLGLGARELVQLTDQYTKFTAQLTIATRSAGEFRAAYDSVRQIATQSQSDVGAVGVLFARLSNALRDVGVQQNAIARVTETVALSLRTSGATAEETRSAMLQLSQAFGSGVLRGEEFNAVNEAAPGLMRALADSIGIPIGQLRTLAHDGRITTEVLLKAFDNQVLLDGLRQQATHIGTLSSAFTVAKNNIMLAIGEMDKMSGTTKTLSKAIVELSNSKGIWTFFQTIAVLGANVSFVLKAIGRDVGALAAQFEVLKSGGLPAWRALKDALAEDHAKARAELDAFERRIMAVGSASELSADQLKGYQGEIRAVENALAKTGAPRMPTKEELAAAKKAAKERADAEKKARDDMAKSWAAYHDQLGEMREAEDTRIREAALERPKHEARAAQESADAWAIYYDQLQEAAYLAGQEIIKADRERKASEKRLLDERVADEKRNWDSLWGRVESTGKTVFAQLLAGGEDAFRSIGQALKASVIDLLYELTARKWLINIGTSFADSIGIGGGSSGGGILGSIGSSLASSALGQALGLPSIGAGFTSFMAGFNGATLGAGLMGPTTAGAGGLMGLGNLAAAIPGWGWAALAATAVLTDGFGLFGDDGPSRPAPQIGLFGPGQLENYQAAPEFNSKFKFGGGFYDAGAAQSLDAANRLINDPSKYDPAVLAQLAKGIQITGGQDESTDSIIAKMLQQLEPARVAAEQKIQQQSNLDAARRQLEIKLMEAQGREQEALNAQRELELAAMDESLRGLAQQIYAAQDLERASKAAAEAQEAIARAQESAARAEEERAQSILGAAEIVRQAYQRERGEIEQRIQQWDSAAQSLRAYGASLTASSGALSYSQALAQFNATASAAMGGDLGAFGKLQGAAETLRSASLARSSTRLDYARDVARIQATLGDAAGFADGRVSFEQLQIERLDSQVNFLSEMNEQLLTTGEAIENLLAVARGDSDVIGSSARDQRKAREILERVTRDGESLVISSESQLDVTIVA